MKPPTYEAVEARLRTAIDAGNRAAMDSIAVELDALDAARRTPTLLASALWYAEQGLHVFPLQPGLKTPMPKSHGCKDATTDADVIRAWWTETPAANVGIATGHLVDVIDIDGPTGVKSWSELYDTLPPVLGTVSTPRAGGTHLYIAATGDGNRAAVWPGIDLRGIGGYVVAPPSVNADGITYTWRSPLQLEEASS